MVNGVVLNRIKTISSMKRIQSSKKNNMTIDRELVLKLENLAKLELSEEERAKLRSDLNNILSMVEKLQELDTAGVEPLVYINEEVSKLREDAIKNQVGQKEALANAPDHDGTYFKVPKVIELKMGIEKLGN